MYGTQTLYIGCPSTSMFENDVKMYGTQTRIWLLSPHTQFENDVKMYGTQTILCAFGHPGSV